MQQQSGQQMEVWVMASRDDDEEEEEVTGRFDDEPNAKILEEEEGGCVTCPVAGEYRTAPPFLICVVWLIRC